MATTTNTAPRSPAPPFGEVLPPASWRTTPLTTEERLEQIAALGERINAYLQFMGKIGSLRGTSAEAKEKAVVAFYERLAALEGQLGRIQENLLLG